MLYLNKDTGSAMGEIINGLSSVCGVTQIELKLTSDEFTALLSVKGCQHKKAIQLHPSTPTKKTSKASHKAKNSTVPATFEYAGITLTADEWANKLGVTDTCIRYRVKKYGNPYGLKGPTDSDKLISGTTSV